MARGRGWGEDVMQERPQMKPMSRVRFQVSSHCPLPGLGLGGSGRFRHAQPLRKPKHFKNKLTKWHSTDSPLHISPSNFLLPVWKLTLLNLSHFPMQSVTRCVSWWRSLHFFPEFYNYNFINFIIVILPLALFKFMLSQILLVIFILWIYCRLKILFGLEYTIELFSILSLILHLYTTLCMVMHNFSYVSLHACILIYHRTKERWN